jgi:multidrug resistance efflux pump
MTTARRRFCLPICCIAAACMLASAAACNRSAEPPPASVGLPTGTAGAESAVTATPVTAVERTVTADGSLVQPLEPQPLSFAVAGTLTEVLVEPGKPVAEGDVLARIDPAPLDLAVAQARAALAQAQAALAKLQSGNLVETAHLSVEQAKNQLWGAQSQRDAVCGAYDQGQKEGGFAKLAAPSEADCHGAQANVQAAEQAVQIAQAQADAAEGSAAPDLASARAAVSSASLALRQAQDNRAQAELVAPFAGTVSAVNVVPGLPVGPGVPVATVDPAGDLQFVTDNLSERDVADIEVGAPASIALTAFPDTPLAAVVGRIADVGTTSKEGVVVFSAWLYLDNAEILPVRAGMTGRAEIQAAPGSG